MKKILLMITMVMFSYMATSLVIEAEKDLRKQKKDTIEGWKMSGV